MGLSDLHRPIYLGEDDAVGKPLPEPTGYGALGMPEELDLSADVATEASPEPTLPSLPLSDECPKTPLQSNRKRTHLQAVQASSSSAYNSSDPAFFTSEDDEAIENYVEGQRKKRYTTGTWYQRHPTSSDSPSQETPRPPKPKQRTFSRQKDSGIWMGSDPADDDGFMVPELPVKPRLPQLDRTPVKRVSKAEQEATFRIQHCLDTGDETIDLMGLGLERLSNEAIGALSQFVFEPPVVKDVFFAHREPELKLYLGLNSLMRVPGALFDLTFLTDLSLRGNELEEIPSAIAKLKNLKSLNVSQNKLRYLPSSLISLIDGNSQLQSLVIHPNPFIWPLAITSSDLSAMNRPSSNSPDQHSPKWTIKHLARSPVQVSSSLGRILSSFQFDPCQRIVPIFPCVKDHSLPEGCPSLNRVPSLVEAALRAASRSDRLAELREYVPDDIAYLAGLLDQARDQKFTGGQHCSGCGTRIIVPILEWVEWLDLRHLIPKGRNTWAYIPLSEIETETPVPFLYRACSWGCGPSTDNKLLVRRPWGIF